MHNILSRLLGILALKILETHGAIGEKKQGKIKITQKIINEFKKVKKNFSNWILFAIKIPTYCKNAFSKILYMVRDIDKNIMCKFLFLKSFSSISQRVFNISKTGFRAEIPIEQNIMHIIVCPVLKVNFLLNCLRYWYSNQIII